MVSMGTFSGLCEIKFYPRPGIVLEIDQPLVFAKNDDAGIQITLVYDTDP